MNITQLYTRHNEVPLLHNREGKVEAVYYNEVQTALKKLGRQIRFPIPKLKHLDLILQKDAWIVVDRALSDFPVLAWTSFQTENRAPSLEGSRWVVAAWATSKRRVGC